MYRGYIIIGVKQQKASELQGSQSWRPWHVAYGSCGGL